jgi:hypothetical protein
MADNSALGSIGFLHEAIRVPESSMNICIFFFIKAPKKGDDGALFKPGREDFCFNSFRFERLSLITRAHGRFRNLTAAVLTNKRFIILLLGSS